MPEPTGTPTVTAPHHTRTGYGYIVAWRAGDTACRVDYTPQPGSRERAEALAKRIAQALNESAEREAPPRCRYVQDGHECQGAVRRARVVFGDGTPTFFDYWCEGAITLRREHGQTVIVMAEREATVDA